MRNPLKPAVLAALIVLVLPAAALADKIDGRWLFKTRVAHVDDEAAVNRVWDFMRKNASIFLKRSEELYK